MTMCPNRSLHRWWTTQWTLDWLCVAPDKTNPFPFCISEKLTFVNVCYFPSSGNVSLQYKIFSWEKSVPNTNRIIMVMRLADSLFGRYRMGLVSSSLYYSQKGSHVNITQYLRSMSNSIDGSLNLIIWTWHKLALDSSITNNLRRSWCLNLSSLFGADRFEIRVR